MPLTATLEEAAKDIGVPKASLRSAAEKHGFLIRMGRQLRIDKSQYQDLMKKCQDQQKEQGSTSSSTDRTGTSATPASRTGQRVAQAASKLKKRSGPTLPPKAGQVLPMNPKT